MMLVEVSILMFTVKMREFSNSSESSQLRLELESNQNSDLGLEPTVFLLKSHTWYKDLLKLRLFMSPRRRNSTRGRVIGKKGVYLERDVPETECSLSQKARVTLGETHFTEERGPLLEGGRPRNMQ